MHPTPKKLGNSAHEQDSLRPAAQWAADLAERALPLFENRYPDDPRPSGAIAAARAFAAGTKRDKNLRTHAWAAHSASSKADNLPAKYAARAALLAAAVAYTHTDLPSVHQARHLLGPAVYAALALEVSAQGNPNIGHDAIRQAAKNAPPQVTYLLSYMPPQPPGKSRLSLLYATLDTALRKKSHPLPANHPILTPAKPPASTTP